MPHQDVLVAQVIDVTTIVRERLVTMSLSAGLRQPLNEEATGEEKSDARRPNPGHPQRPQIHAKVPLRRKAA